MTKSEAIYAMLDGEKVKLSNWIGETYIRFNGESFVREDGSKFEMNRERHGRWEPYVELVDFSKAWDHMMKGYEAKLYTSSYHILNNILRSRTGSCANCSNEKITGKWILLDIKRKTND